MTRSVERMEVSPVGTARCEGSSVVCARWSIRVRSERDALASAGVVRPVGERKKSSDHVFRVVPNGFLEPFCKS